MIVIDPASAGRSIAETLKESSTMKRLMILSLAAVGLMALNSVVLFV